MAFVKSAKTERMLKTVRTYLAAWASPSPHDTASLLKLSVHPRGVLYRADGVLHTQDRHKSVQQLADHIAERHAAYRHLVFDELAAAVDEDSNTAFLAVRFVLQNVGPVAGQEPSGRPTEGVLVERLDLDPSEGLITKALVCRQLTHEEASSLTYDPSAVHTAPMEDAILYAAQEPLTEQDVKAMRANAVAWVGAWDAEADVSAIVNKVMAPDVRQVSAYGLSRRPVPFSDANQARSVVMGSLDAYPGNANTLLGLAIADDRRAGFAHWQSTGLSAMAKAPESQEGMDYMRFDKNNRISFILDFTMRPYTNVRQDDAPRADGVD